MALPVLYNRPVHIGQYEYLDGGVALPLPVFELISRFNPTDVLVILNRPMNYKGRTPLIERVATHTVLTRFSKQFRKQFLRKESQFDNGLNVIHASHNGAMNMPNISVLYHEQELVTRATKNTVLLHEAAYTAADEAYTIFK